MDSKGNRSGIPKRIRPRFRKESFRGFEGNPSGISKGILHRFRKESRVALGGNPLGIRKGILQRFPWEFIEKSGKNSQRDPFEESDGNSLGNPNTS